MINFKTLVENSKLDQREHLTLIRSVRTYVEGNPAWHQPGFVGVSKPFPLDAKTTKLDARKSALKGKTGKSITFDVICEDREHALKVAKEFLDCYRSKKTNLQYIVDSRIKMGGWFQGKWLPVIHIVDKSE